MELDDYELELVRNALAFYGTRANLAPRIKEAIQQLDRRMKFHELGMEN